jgi:hypothetical protein
VNRRRIEGGLLAVLLCLTALGIAQPALACPVCFGDPSSSMGQGVQAGVWVLLGVVGAVLAGLLALVIFWMRRAASLKRLVSADGEAG